MSIIRDVTKVVLKEPKPRSVLKMVLSESEPEWEHLLTTFTCT